MTTLQKTDDKSFVRNPDNAAILNTDTSGFKSYREDRARILKVQQLSNTVETLQQDMADIKSMLQQLVNGRTNG